LAATGALDHIIVMGRLQGSSTARRALQGQKKKKRKHSEVEETFEEDDGLIIDDGDDAPSKDDAEEEADPLANETPAEKRLRMGACTPTGQHELVALLKISLFCA
jgi:hypothetical protein